MKKFKVCPKCSDKCGCRTIKCKKCNYEFISKKDLDDNSTNKKPVRRRRKKKNKYIEPDWTTLKNGDIIKVLQSHGPYYPGEEKKIPMSYSGFFQVHRVCEDGILAISIKKANISGFCYIYMGQEKEGASGTRLCPHKILYKPPNIPDQKNQ